jgi:hypothetical protein
MGPNSNIQSFDHRTINLYLAGCGKSRSVEEGTTSGAKARLISRGLRGPKGPLFHGEGHILEGEIHILEFFRSLLENQSK